MTPNEENILRATKEEMDLIRYFMGKDFYSGILLVNVEWNWLMAVVEKIEGMKYNVNILRTDCSIYCDLFRNQNDGYRKSNHANSKIRSVWKSVIEFIKYYKTTS